MPLTMWPHTSADDSHRITADCTSVANTPWKLSVKADPYFCSMYAVNFRTCGLAGVKAMSPRSSRLPSRFQPWVSQAIVPCQMLLLPCAMSQHRSGHVACVQIGGTHPVAPSAA